MTVTGEENGRTLSASIEILMPQAEAFDIVVEDLVSGLARHGMQLEPRAGGTVTQGPVDVGRILTWEPGRRIVLRWQQASWEPGEVTEMEISCSAAGEFTRVSMEHRGWGRLLGGEGETAGWFAGSVLAPLMSAMSPGPLGDWITDRRARKPTGRQSAAIYRDPLYHYPGFRAIIAELALTPEDNVLEVGCGGGVLIRRMLDLGCRCTGIDHSAEMVRLASEINREAIREGKASIIEAGAEHLPLSNSTFTCATMHGVLGFIPDPVRALSEIHRVLAPGGRIVIEGIDPSMRGTPAAPEPMASRLQFTDDTQLQEIGRRAGFAGARVVRRSLEQYAREAGIPEEHISLFAGAGMPFLVARKDTR